MFKNMDSARLDFNKMINMLQAFLRDPYPFSMPFKGVPVLFRMLFSTVSFCESMALTGRAGLGQVCILIGIRPIQQRQKDEAFA